MEREPLRLIKDTVEKWLDEKLSDVSIAVARQLGVRSLEYVVLQLASEENVTVLTFGEDAWTSSNPLKKEYINPRKVVKGKKSYYPLKVKIAEPENYEVLNYIKTFNGCSLPEFYERRRLNVRSVVDISYLFGEIARELIQNGYEAFLGNIFANVKVGDKIKSVKLYYKEGMYYLGENPMSIEEVLELNYIRPTMEFYYKYILIPMFSMRDNIKLLVTPWENDDWKVRAAAMEGYRVTKEYFGKYPNIEYFFDINLSEILKRKLGKHPGYALVDEEMWEKIRNRVKAEGSNMYEKTRNVVKLLEQLL